MSTDWIKMRVDLRTHPKVVRMATALRADKLRVIGGLFAVWAIFDAHSSDGILDGYTFAAIDGELSWKGFAAAMNGIGWLDDDTGDGLTAPRFEEHNGQSAKRRAMENARKAAARESIGDVRTKAERLADFHETESGQMSASNADTKRAREEKRRKEEEIQKPGRATSSAQSRDPDDDRPPEANGHDPTPAGAICLALRRRAKFAAVNPGDPRLAALISLGIPEETFVSVATEAVEKSKGWAWVLTVVERRHEEGLAIAAKPKAAAPPANAWTQKRSAVIDRACELGIGPWNESAAINRTGPSWEQYRARVIEADTHGVTS